METLDGFLRRYAPDPSVQDDPRASPLLAKNLAGLPPALVQTAGFDPLRDEGQAYAARLTARAASAWAQVGRAHAERPRS